MNDDELEPYDELRFAGVEVVQVVNRGEAFTYVPHLRAVYCRAGLPLAGRREVAAAVIQHLITAATFTLGDGPAGAAVAR